MINNLYSLWTYVTYTFICIIYINFNCKLSQSLQHAQIKGVSMYTFIFNHQANRTFEELSKKYHRKHLLTHLLINI